MKMKEAVSKICSLFDDDVLVVSANGAISRELYAARHRSGNFYMLGSMGQASSIGLGVALSQPEKKVVILDGDGNLLMNLGILANVRQLKPRNLFHIVLDNGVYNTTGGQPTAASVVSLASVAKACGYKTSAEAATPARLVKIVRKMLASRGPAMAVARISTEVNKELVRIPLTPAQMKKRFRGAAVSRKGSLKRRNVRKIEKPGNPALGGS